MSIDLVTKFAPYTDEIFKNESKKSLLTNEDFSFDGAHTVKVYKVSTSQMNNYGRSGPAGSNWSRYGAVVGLDAVTEDMTITKDRSFTFTIDKLDANETAGQLTAASALARQLREKVVPEVDTYTYGEMCENAGQTPTAAALTAANIYDKIITASTALDNEEVPEDGRFLVVTPAILQLMKKNTDILMSIDITNELRKKGVVGILDGSVVIKVPAVRLPATFGFLMGHPKATVAPTKLADYRVHNDPPGISGALVEGRIVYDAFVLDNKADALYYYSLPAA